MAENHHAFCELRNHPVSGVRGVPSGRHAPRSGGAAPRRPRVRGPRLRLRHSQGRVRPARRVAPAPRGPGAGRHRAERRRQVHAVQGAERRRAAWR